VRAGSAYEMPGERSAAQSRGKCYAARRAASAARLWREERARSVMSQVRQRQAVRVARCGGRYEVRERSTRQQAEPGERIW